MYAGGSAGAGVRAARVDPYGNGREIGPWECPIQTHCDG